MPMDLLSKAAMWIQGHSISAYALQKNSAFGATRTYRNVRYPVAMEW